MGSPFNIILYSNDSVRAAATAAASFALVDSLVNIFSDYIDSSELNRLSGRAGKASAPMIISPALYYLLVQSKMAFEKSEGSFDITLGSLSKLWRQARKSNIFPTDSAVIKARQLTGFHHLIIDTASHSALLLQPGMQLDMGGIAQGYIAQEVIHFLQTKNITDALVDVSGDIVAIGAPPGTGGWKIGISKPEQKEILLKKHLLISNKAVTTSGDVYQYMEHDGKRYSHLIDPKTGYGITTQKNVTVIADDGTTADWLTKACSILSIGKAKKLARNMNAALLITTIKKGRVVYYSNKLFRQYQQL